MASSEVYTKGTRIWIPDEMTVWRGAVLLEDYKGQDEIKIRLTSDEPTLDDSDMGQETSYRMKNKKDGKEQLPLLRNPDILIGENDLTSLSYLNEAEVLYNLRVRFVDRRTIYTYCGIVLVAVNPYDDLPIYSVEMIHAYEGKDLGQVEPHIFAVAEEAYKRMSRFDQNQSIIVSGESGAGKTVSAKYAMRYIATVCSSLAERETQVEKKVLSSNPIMEAFGNAKTTRNDNSSRFGKYIEVGFSSSNHIVGAHMRTYLLEKSRVVFQSTDERNYHIFYQLMSAQKDPDFESLCLKSPSDFVYTNQGRNPIIRGVDDAVEFEQTRLALTTLGFSNTTQTSMFRILSAILHFGNVRFVEHEKHHEASIIPPKDPHLEAFARLLEVNEEQLRVWMCARKIQTASESVTKPLSVREACNARDALAKTIYARMFGWIVERINVCFAGRDREKQLKFIGILDIYGFETFAVNSFEQFCINYANEKLQQQFTLHVFKLEQEEYVREQIEWSFINFLDNQQCIDLIETKLGILDLLDEECRMPKGSDANWCLKLYENFVQRQQHSHFLKPKLSRSSFIVRHFADSVEYESEGFLEKNRDQIFEDQYHILIASDLELLVEILEERYLAAAEPVPSANAPKGRILQSTAGTTVTVRSGSERPAAGAQAQARALRRTVGSQFRESLKQLMDTLNSTTPHYVRCIKSNDAKESFAFDERRAVQQLRACGVLETIRISAAGFPSRWSYAEFVARYRCLAHSKQLVRGQLRQTAANMLSSVFSNPDRYRCGKTKIFFRAGQVAWLEKRRSERLAACCVTIQRHVRGWLARIRYARIRTMVHILQRRARGMLARRDANRRLGTRAACRVQAAWRAHRARTQFAAANRAAVIIQCAYRGWRDRRSYRRVRLEHATTAIQAFARGHLARRRAARALRGIILLQSHFRRRRARRELLRLRTEARSIDHIRSKNVGLENKIIELQQRLDDKARLAAHLDAERKREAQLAAEREHRAKTETSNEHSRMQHRVSELEARVADLEHQLAEERSNNSQLRTQIAESSQRSEQLAAELAKGNLEQRAAGDSRDRELGEKDAALERALKENRRLQQSVSEFEARANRHQQLMREHDRLERKFENLQKQLEYLTETGAIKPDVRDQLLRPRASSNMDDVEPSASAIRSPPVVGPDAPFAAITDANHPNQTGLVLQLQRRVSALEEERAALRRQLERRAGGVEGAADHAGDEAWDANDAGFSRTASIRHREVQMTAVRNQELESRCTALERDLASLRDAAVRGGDAAAFELRRQLEAMNAELSQRREEVITWRARYVDTPYDRVSAGSLAPESGNASLSFNPDESEVTTAYRAQLEANRRLLAEVSAFEVEKKRMSLRVRELTEQLRVEAERAQRLTSLQDSNATLQDALQTLALAPEAKLERTMQHEITRLTAENLDLREQNERAGEQLRKLRRALRNCVRRLQKYEGDLAGLETDEPDNVAEDVGDGSGMTRRHNDSSSAREWRNSQAEAGRPRGAFSATRSAYEQTPSASNVERESALEEAEEAAADPDATLPRTAAVARREHREMEGMLEFRPEDEAALIKSLINDLTPAQVVNMTPCLPAHALFMCIRYIDRLNDDSRVQSLMTSALQSIKRCIKRQPDDLQLHALWLANSYTFLNDLKQFSGEEIFQIENTPRQNEQCLSQFDLSEFRQIVADLCVWIFESLMKIVREDLQSQLIVCAILEHEAIPNLLSGKPSGSRSRTQNSGASPAHGSSGTARENPLDVLLKKLTYYVNELRVYAVDADLIDQLFQQIFYIICAHSLNNLLLRKELCNFQKGIQIRYNLTHLESWLRENGLKDSGASAQLQPITQACQLLQARKSEKDVDAICELCSKLTISQIAKLLNLYTPVNDFEERVSVTFIKQVHQKLAAERPQQVPITGAQTARHVSELQQSQQQPLLMSTKPAFPVTFPFRPTYLQFEQLEMPNDLRLPHPVHRI